MFSVFETLLPAESLTSKPIDFDAKHLYFALLNDPSLTAHQRASTDCIETSLAEVRPHPSPLPADLNGLEQWLTDQHRSIGEAYREYLEGRQAGKPRRYFTSRAHALYFIRAVAPTKMVDGAWLYGTLRYWRDPRLAALMKIYLEELGDGHETMNHVALYRRLLKTHECEDWHDLPAPFFKQGALQLSLAYNAEAYLPEVIGFNLGYEQLPLHLLITAYELNELNIDPYYFSLHVTIDNAQSGHAKNAIETVRDALPLIGDRQAYIRRVIAGAKLNDIGLGTVDIIEGFDLELELIHILQKKAALGRYMHSDRCQLQGQSINQWLNEQARIPAFLAALQKEGWVRRHEDPDKSRFWKTIAGDGAPMFGVFTRYERQVIYDWIAGDALESLPRQKRLGKPWRQRQTRQEDKGMAPKESGNPNNVYKLNLKKTVDSPLTNAINSDIKLFETRLRSLNNLEQQASLCIEWLSPSRHHTPIGLLATRHFKSLALA